MEVVLEEITETLIETAAKEAAETMIEEASQQFVEDQLQEAVQADVQKVIQTGVDDAVESAAETAAQNAREEGVGQSVEQAECSFWKQIFWDKIFPVMITGISAGEVIEIISRIIDASISSSAGAASTTSEATIANLLASKKLLAKLTEVTERWKAELQKYKDMNDAFGSFKFNSKYENANTTVAILFTSMNSDLEAANALAEQSHEQDYWDENITEFQWYIIDAVSRLLAVYKVKAGSKNMQELGFPFEDDERVLQAELDYKSIIKRMVEKHLGNATDGDVATATQAIAQKIIKPPLEREITKLFNATVRPAALAEGKIAAKAEVRQVFNENAMRINRHAAIPIYGLVTLKQWMKTNVEPEAKRRSKEKSIAAAKATLLLPDAQIQMMKISQAAKAKVLTEYKEEIYKAVLDAAKKAIENAQK